MWSSPLTEKPQLEPCFAAAFHGIELCFLLLAEFVADKRKVGEPVTQASGLVAAASSFHTNFFSLTAMLLMSNKLHLATASVSCWRYILPAVQYVAKRPRIDMVATDIQEQCMLLTEVTHPASPWLLLSSAACTAVAQLC